MKEPPGLRSRSGPHERAFRNFGFAGLKIESWIIQIHLKPLGIQRFVYCGTIAMVRSSCEPGPNSTLRLVLVSRALHPGPPSGSSFTFGILTTIPG